MEEKLEVKYVPLGTIRKWNKNAKLHDIGSLVDSIQKHGFKDPMKFEPALNDGSGGIVEGNGRDQALTAMFEQAPLSPPRGVLVDGTGAWLVPVLFGVDAPSQAAAEAYAIDHNNLTLMGGDFDAISVAALWESDGLRDILEGIDPGGLASFDDEDIALLLRDADFLSEYDPEAAEEKAKRHLIRIVFEDDSTMVDAIEDIRILLDSKGYKAEIHV